ncbi:sensor histidine kinase [Amycolatopsis nigrescens]|uniref:sensor histidine kinase n=1 Tax=Amycolatopsis nigrescens TaxID=381445 RepID=UPI000367497B|nr:histidine kinase [Amycolatopsis nigrescens]
MKPSRPAAQARLHRLNLVTTVPPLAAVGALLVVIDAKTWWHAVVLSLGVVAALVASTAWATGRLNRVALPCLIVAAAVWPLGVLVTDSHTAFYGITIVGPIIIPTLPRHRGAASLGLTAFVAAVGAAKLLVSPANVPDVLTGYVLIPAGVAVVTIAFMFAGQRFYDLVTELEQSREREAELAVIRERMRFASDLHDIQGHTLHVVKLKVTLAEKLVHSDLERVQEELREVRALVGDTITQTKELAHAQRRLNLSAELENAKNLFEAAGIRVRVDREAEVDGHAGELLGQVLRETTTNILRHAEAGQVRITLSESGIAIVNDGAQEAPLPELSGLSTLRQRLADNGGELTVEQKAGRFLTAAAFPHVRPGTAL